jgi:hypothetical protein
VCIHFFALIWTDGVSKLGAETCRCLIKISIKRVGCDWRFF